MSLVNDQAWKVRKLMREAEAVTDEALIACAKLKQEMLTARRLPEFKVGAGQAEVLRLNRAEQNLTAAINDLLRVHDGLSDIVRVTAGTDEDIPTEREDPQPTRITGEVDAPLVA